MFMLNNTKICIFTRTFPPMKCGIGDYVINLAEVIYR